MKKWWWKILGVILMIYTLIVGMLVPLKMGINGIDNQNIASGVTSKITLHTYNSHLDEADVSAFLRIDSSGFIAADEVTVISYDEVELEFSPFLDMPEGDSIVTASLILYNEIDGVASLPRSVFIKGKPGETAIAPNVVKGLPDHITRVGGFRYPYRPILHETVRNIFFHVTLWMSMFILLIASLIFAIRYLRTRNIEDDHKSKSFTMVAILFGILGVVTGSLWARFTWEAWWISDVKLNMTTIAMLIYLAYIVLRSSIADQDQQAKVASAYNIFAFVAMIPLVFVIPRLMDSLHPGNGGNPALGGEDLDNTLRAVFYPSIIGLTLIGVWLAQLYYRSIRVKEAILLKRPVKV